MNHAGSALGASVPAWDLPTLALSLSWPSELSLPQQLPLFVSAGWAGVELLQKAWRWSSKRLGLSTSDEIQRRVRDHVLPPHQADNPAVRLVEPKELRHAVRNPAAAALETAELELGPAGKKTRACQAV